MNKRIRWIDIAKGILILLVIIGHCEVGSCVKYVIYSFHMGAFFFLSGLTFSAKNNPKVFVTKKVKSLLLPYCFFSVLLTAYNFAKHIVFSSAFNLKDAIMSFFVPISGKYESSVYGLWFLPCIFLTELLLYSIIRFYSKNKVVSVIYGITVVVGFGLIFIFTKIACVVTIIPISILCILCGYLAKRVLFKIYNYRAFAFAVSFVVFTLLVILNNILSDSSLDLSSLNLGCVPIYILSTFFGSVAVCTISMCIEKIKFTKLITYIGINSLYFYGFHYEVLGLISSLIRNPYVDAVLTITCLLPIVFVYTKIKSKIEGIINDQRYRSCL